MKLFRYYHSKHGLSVLNDLELRTSIPNTLNDPFELSPNVDPSQFTQKKCEAFLRADHQVDHWYKVEGRKFGFTSKKAYKRHYLKDVRRRAAQLMPKVPKNVETVRQNFADDFSKRWRLVCASQVVDSILMWSHYAENHTGVVLELDTEHEPFTQLADLTFPVAYSSAKPNYVHCNKYPDFQKALFSVATTKATEWGYEKEVRIIVAAGKPLRDSLYMPITAQAITAVVCGCRMPPAVKLDLRTVLRQPHFSHVRFVQAALDQSQYALTFEDDVP